MTYGCQTWSMTKAVGQKLRVAQRAMESKMLGLKLTDKISCKEIRNKTQVSDIAQYIAKQKWKWAGHVARLQDNRWTLRVTEWQPRNGKRSRGRQARRWRDDIVTVRTMGNTWTREAKDKEEWRRGAEALSCSGWTEPESINQSINKRKCYLQIEMWHSSFLKD
ncbi:endonuclease-reverse transcriptase [Elysia marginata]|uniref:Endonuclease-reverse transcriptase n=1 Tax=Elysia marginata TaxID=1093978 RepID=A0AAV4JBP2_9GAST|nr:endonuclease-reverse transcriptase [Elysia marginata]